MGKSYKFVDKNIDILTDNLCSKNDYVNMSTK